MKTKSTSKAKPAPKTEKAKAKKADEIFKSVKKYPDEGKRADAQKFIPSRGATFDTILKASKLKPNKLRRYLRGLVRHGCVKRLAA